MKPAVAKALKITGITLGSIVGVVLIAVSILCYVVFTPKRLTPIVNQVADSLILQMVHKVIPYLLRRRLLHPLSYSMPLREIFTSINVILITQKQISISPQMV